MVERVKKNGRTTGWRGACTWLALVTALALLGPAPALGLEESEQSGWARANDVGRTVFDLVILRPLQVVQVAVSAVVFVPAYPVSLLFDGDEDVLEICITEPVERAFRRPLGDL
jgi:hypothetical protein